MDEFHELIMGERAVIQAVRDSERDTRELLQQRAREELNIFLVTPYPDASRYLPKDIKEEEVKVCDHIIRSLPSAHLAYDFDYLTVILKVQSNKPCGCVRGRKLTSHRFGLLEFVLDKNSLFNNNGM